MLRATHIAGVRKGTWAHNSRYAANNCGDLLTDAFQREMRLAHHFSISVMIINVQRELRSRRCGAVEWDMWRSELPFVRLDCCASSWGCGHLPRFHAHQRIFVRISCQSWCQPSSRPISMFAFAVPVALHMAAEYGDWNRNRTTRCSLERRPLWLHARHQRSILRTWTLLHLILKQ